MKRLPIESKYPVLYYSQSKKVELPIESLATPHLLNSWRKLQADATEDVPASHHVLVGAMEDELRERGCTYDPATGRWTLPEKEGGA